MVDEVNFAMLLIGLIGVMYCIWKGFDDQGGTPCH